jgi:hypothetical protein
MEKACSLSNGKNKKNAFVRKSRYPALTPKTRIFPDRDAAKKAFWLEPPCPFLYPRSVLQKRNRIVPLVQRELLATEHVQG